MSSGEISAVRMTVDGRRFVPEAEVAEAVAAERERIQRIVRAEAVRRYCESHRQFLASEPGHPHVEAMVDREIGWVLAVVGGRHTTEEAQ